MSVSKQRLKLTDEAVEKLRYDGEGFALFRDTAEPGFCIRVYATGRKVFYWNGRARGQSYNRKLGEFENRFRCGQARDMAAQTRVAMKSGVDPLLEQRAERERKALEREKAAVEGLTLGDAITALVAARKLSGKIGKTTQDEYKGLRDNELAPYANTPLSTIDRSTAEKWLREIAQAIKKRRKTFDGHFRANKALRLVRTTMIANKLPNPCAEEAGAKFPWYKEPPKECDLEPHHAPKLWQNLDAAGTDERAAFYAVLMMTGMRSIDALRLRFGDINLEHGFLDLANTKNKTNHRVYIPTQLDEVLRPFVEGKRKTATVFPRCKHIAPQLHKVCAAAKAPLSSNHNLRHLWAIIATEVGVPYPVLVKCINHSTRGNVTLNHYAKPTPSQLRKGWQQVADYIAPQAAETAEASVTELAA